MKRVTLGFKVRFGVGCDKNTCNDEKRLRELVDFHGSHVKCSNHTASVGCGGFDENAESTHTEKFCCIF